MSVEGGPNSELGWSGRVGKGKGPWETELKVGQLISQAGHLPVLTGMACIWTVEVCWGWGKGPRAVGWWSRKAAWGTGGGEQNLGELDSSAGRKQLQMDPGSYKSLDLLNLNTLEFNSQKITSEQDPDSTGFTTNSLIINGTTWNP